MKTIEIGKITIIERETKPRDGVDHTTYEIFAESQKYSKKVSVPDVRLAVLAALGYEQFGLNNQFAAYAAKMLEIDGDIWHVSG